ncbi:hypothetical protein VFPPC_02608 [Pochonia chlamydosporia 170]|uniref:Uncharacterized protein n=1 Tax=Pochonia chlamydosporia 170 TaxID=1380566 RepID=A0A179FWR5_METCM|nr:hypothetical protein VFPPC_02608 [Pochonia chlamydosporia 170]OAQ70074.1 hypothetical protein VFPPC_02608 [Pochonia chlamydosporia 170]
MAPIPVYSSSPINAAKPTGVTPKTSNPGDSNKSGQILPDPSQTSGEQAYPPAQPGARPALPKETGIPVTPPQPGGHVLATPTRTTTVGNSPPPPQPGAVPVPLGGSTGSGSGIPPPPKAGESLQSTQQSPPVTTMPPQMGYQPPQASLPVQARSSTATTAGPPPQAGATAAPTYLQGNYPTAGFSPPAGGYQQDVNAAGYNSYQRSTVAYEDQSEASVWDTAKKWAASAGESLAAAENEVWKRINKD